MMKFKDANSIKNLLINIIKDFFIVFQSCSYISHINRLLIQ